jgi:anti-repressor protein
MTATNENNMFEQMFKNKEINTYKDNRDVVWFKGKDVASILGYAASNEKKSIRKYVQDEDRITWKQLKLRGSKMDPLKQDPQTVFIDESGVNSLVMKSKKPNAKKFQHWITVIPQIRKHGFYHHKEHKPSALAHEDGYARINRQ